MNHRNSSIQSIMTFGTFASLLAIVAGCGGGGGGGLGVAGGGSTSVADISGTGISSGPIDAFGSIIVNGVEFDTGSATFTVDDAPGTQADLAVGQIVTVRGTFNGDGTGFAESVDADHLVEGPIDSIDGAAKTLVALGQTVRVDAKTVFAGATFASLMTGEFVVVDGFFEANGDLRATYVELDSTPSAEFEVRGFARSVDGLAQTFLLGALEIDYSNASVDTSTGEVGEGMLVEVKGTRPATTFLATEVEEEDFSGGATDGDELDVEGVVTAVLSATAFRIGPLTVRTTGGTEFENGTAADIAVGVQVEAEGTVDGSGELVATKVELRRDLEVRLSSNVEAVDLGAKTVTLLGVVFVVDEDTQLEDESAVEREPFTLADISVGDRLELRAFRENGNLRAGRLERNDPEDGIDLRGPIDSSDLNSRMLVVAGATVETDGATSFSDAQGDSITEEQFYATPSGTTVEIQQDAYFGGTVLADSAEIEGSEL